MSIRGGGTVWEGVDARNNHIVRVADFKVAGSKATTKRVLRRAVEAEANAVESVLAETLGVFAVRVADLDAELVVTNESTYVGENNYQMT